MENISERSVVRLYSAIVDRLVSDAKLPEYKEEVKEFLVKESKYLEHLTTMAEIDHQSVIDKIESNLGKSYER